MRTARHARCRGVDRLYGIGAPPGMPADNWSARFSGDLRFPQAGIYSFRLFADDGVRLHIDDKVVINQ